MKSTDHGIAGLIRLSNFLDRLESPNDCLHKLAAEIAGIFNTRQCSIMLPENGDDHGGTRQGTFAHYGFPAQAWGEATNFVERIAGHATVA